MLTVSHGWLGEKDQARKACRKAAELLTPAAANAALHPLVRKAVMVVGLDSPEAAELLVAAASEPPSALTEAIHQNPDQAAGYRERGKWYANHWQWKKAADDLGEAVRLEPDISTSLSLGPLLAHLGERDRYREHCQAMLARWAETTENYQADQTAKTCLLLADSRVDPDRLAKLVQVAVSGDENQPWFEWFLHAKGLHAYRTGRFSEALASCQKSRRRAPSGTQAYIYSQQLIAADWVVEAMALHRQGEAAAARQSLGEAKRLIDEGFALLDALTLWENSLTAHILYREAETLIEGQKVEPKAAGPDRPAH